MIPLWTIASWEWQSRCGCALAFDGRPCVAHRVWPTPRVDRKSTRLNSSHSQISYAVFCLKKKKKQEELDHALLPMVRTLQCLKHTTHDIQTVFGLCYHFLPTTRCNCVCASPCTRTTDRTI